MKNYEQKTSLSSIPNSRRENNKFLLSPDSYFGQGQLLNGTVLGRNSEFARQGENSYFAQDNSRNVSIHSLRRRYTPFFCDLEHLCITFNLLP